MNYFLWELYVATSSTCLLNHCVSVSFCNLLQIELPHTFISFPGYNSLFVTTIEPVTFQLVMQCLNPLNTELNPIYHLLALLAHPILHISRIRVKQLCHCIGCTTFHYKIMTLCDIYSNSELFTEMWIEFNETIYGKMQ
jgi:hypothetical protein